MSSTVIDRFMAIVEASELDKRQETFITIILSLLALKLSRLTPAAQQQMLQNIEDNGGLLQMALRQWSPNGAGWLQ